MGCAGGGGSPGDGDGSGLLSGDEVAASMAAVDAHMDSVSAASAADLNASLLEFLGSRSDFVNSGATDDGVWGTLANGGTYFVVTNRAPVPGENAENPVVTELAAGTDVPRGSILARMLNGMGPAFANEPAILRPAVSDRGYTAAVGGADLATLAAFGFPAFFYLSAHGGTCSIPQLDARGRMVNGADGRPIMLPDYAVSTTTEANAAAIAARMADFESGIIVAARMLEDYVGGVAVQRTRFMVTSRWVTRYWQFATDSLVWISACSSLGAGAAPFIAACQAKGAGLYVGWTDTVGGPAAVAASKFAVDRLLGANRLAPLESPKQRSFDYEEVWADLARADLHRDQVLDSVSGAAIAGRVAELKYQAKAGTNFGLLAPSIRYVLVDESADEVHLYGIFGTPPADERVVLIDGLEASVKSWDREEIVCDLPRSGQGSKGDVKVSVRAHDSNVRQITEWNIQLQYTWDNHAEAGLKVDGPFTVRFRGDVGEYREHPHLTPTKPVRCFAASLDSLATLTASGTYSSGGCTTTWSGSVDFPASNWHDGAQGPRTVLLALLKVDTQNNTGALGLALGGTPEDLFTEVDVCEGQGTQTFNFAPAQSILHGPETFTVEWPGQPSVGVPLPALAFSYGENYSMTGQRFIDIELDQLTMEYPAVTATWPPDTAAAREEG